jgi:hypothetical protein
MSQKKQLIILSIIIVLAFLALITKEAVAEPTPGMYKIYITLINKNPSPGPDPLPYPNPYPEPGSIYLPLVEK